ncbi:MAG TPA: monofunctional biosynthetic peptidoglycan transglycosylase [Anaeromyxobacteraceae bacterium]|nr:monofunctional biosynthetic peptidoglycan transglycosylase [Anaeromyxobacteraceae bacterium]
MPARSFSLRRILPRALSVAAALAAAGAAVVAYLWATLPDPSPLARQNPRTTALMEQRRGEARAARRPFRIHQTWVGLDGISRFLVDAVVLSEDARFFGHEGFDWEAIREAAEADLKAGRFARGASTITQQLAKNLYLGTEKKLSRKVKEAVLSAKLERTLSKRRILAVYLNVAEWGDGVFGVEAGARHHLGVSAAALSPAEAAVLASMLPAPRRVDLARPSGWLRERSRRLLDRMREAGHIDDPAHLHAAAELERILAGPAPEGDQGGEPPEDEEPVETAGAAGATPEAPSPLPAASPPAAPTPAATPPPTAPTAPAAPEPASHPAPGPPDPAARPDR